MYNFISYTIKLIFPGRDDEVAPSKPVISIMYNFYPLSILGPSDTVDLDDPFCKFIIFHNLLDYLRETMLKMFERDHL